MMLNSADTAILRFMNTLRKINQMFSISKVSKTTLKKTLLHLLIKSKNSSKTKILNGTLLMCMPLSIHKWELGQISLLPLMRKLFKLMNYLKITGPNLEMGLSMEAYVM
jgi:hypothetical protein